MPVTKSVVKVELFVDHNHESGVVQVIQSDELGRKSDPYSLTVDREFVMGFSELFCTSQQEEIAALTAQKQSLLGEKQTLQSQINAQQLQIASLKEQVTNLLPWNPRWISPAAFVARFTALQTRNVYESIDEIIIGGRQLLSEYLAANYQIVLDDPQVTGLLTYMVSVGLLTDPEKENILRDSSSSERYVPTVTE
jgi:hypothetical protein